MICGNCNLEAPDGVEKTPDEPGEQGHNSVYKCYLALMARVKELEAYIIHRPCQACGNPAVPERTECVVCAALSERFGPLLSGPRGSAEKAETERAQSSNFHEIARLDKRVEAIASQARWIHEKSVDRDAGLRRKIDDARESLDDAHGIIEAAHTNQRNIEKRLANLEHGVRNLFNERNAANLPDHFTLGGVLRRLDALEDVAHTPKEGEGAVGKCAHVEVRVAGGETITGPGPIYTRDGLWLCKACFLAAP